MLPGILFSLLAGMFITILSVFNANASEKIGLWQTNTIVHGLGLVVSLIIFMMVRDGTWKDVQETNKLYLVGGALGVVIVFSVMKGIVILGPAYSVSILLIAQLLLAVVVNTFGWFGVEPVSFSFSKMAGIMMMIGGILVFQLK
ncbi:DMT family transporter [Bacillus coahuilensis]|uniref:DMT family transporter n=1 Tax=Bacillus coahuilensis TaxID=408580 RepID=UPI00018512E7|nr:DMT family transporter [Bacillus coahuilensis]